MSAPTYRAAVYERRIIVNLPKSLGPVDLTAQTEGAGVLITLKATPYGKLSGSGAGDRWTYSLCPDNIVRLPRIGMTEAELRKGLTDDGVLQLWVPSGRKVEARIRGERKAKQSPELPSPTKHTNPLIRLGELVRQINERKAELGDALVLEVTSEGRLRALVEYT